MEVSAKEWADEACKAIGQLFMENVFLKKTGYFPQESSPDSQMTATNTGDENVPKNEEKPGG